MQPYHWHVVVTEIGFEYVLSVGLIHVAQERSSGRFCEDGGRWKIS
jgi:hypothetical protein